MKKNLLLKRWFAGMLSTMILASTLTGCSQKSGTAQSNVSYYNKAFQTSGMKTISGESFDTENNENCFYIRSLGAGAIFTDLLNEKKTETKELQLSLVKENGLVFGYDVGIKEFVSASSSENKEDLNQVMSFCTKLEDAPYEHQFLLAGIWREDETAQEADFEEFKSHFKHMEKMVSADNYAYYFGWNDEFDTSTLNKEEKKDLKAVVKDVQGLKDKLCFFRPEVTQNDSAKFEGDFTNFTAKDSEGNTVTQDIFKDYDLTMVNIWRTGNNACIEEMAELERLRTMLPDNVNLLSICADGSSESELMKQILKEKGCKFQTLVDGNSLNSAVLEHVSLYPTTLFVDKNGNVVGQPQVGTPATKSEIGEIGDLAEMMGDDVVIGAVNNLSGINADSTLESYEGGAIIEMPTDGDLSAAEGEGFIISGDDIFDMEGGDQLMGEISTISEAEEKSIAERYLDIIKKYLEYIDILK